ncbi:hypothetical protein E5288_WYG018478 [Bos mutus]|uniref:Uncharacterized protein n=1 Tax=Bos mutus TaxID=72004 RepID=A0A6B0RWK8_9CETA|nr:hypothetical protein [Bos mutus]
MDCPLTVHSPPDLSHPGLSASPGLQDAGGQARLEPTWSTLDEHPDEQVEGPASEGRAGSSDLIVAWTRGAREAKELLQVGPAVNQELPFLYQKDVPIGALHPRRLGVGGKSIWDKGLQASRPLSSLSPPFIPLPLGTGYESRAPMFESHFASNKDQELVNRPVQLHYQQQQPPLPPDRRFWNISLSPQSPGMVEDVSCGLKLNRSSSLQDSKEEAGAAKAAVPFMCIAVPCRWVEVIRITGLEDLQSPAWGGPQLHPQLQSPVSTHASLTPMREPDVNLVVGSEQDQTKDCGNGAFDKFIIRTRALTPP